MGKRKYTEEFAIDYLNQFGYKYIIVKDYDNRMSPLKAYTTILDLINKNTFNVTVS